MACKLVVVFFADYYGFSRNTQLNSSVGTRSAGCKWLKVSLQHNNMYILILQELLKLYNIVFLSCSIVEDFELIAAAFADRGEGIVFTTPDIAFVAENVSETIL